MKIRLREKIGYGCGDLGSQFAYGLITTYFLMYLTDILGIPSKAAGTLIMVALIFDAVNDLAIGVIIDARKAKGHNYASFMKAACIPYGIFLVLCFINPASGYAGKMIWAYLIYLIYTVASTCFQMPYGSMANYMTTDINERVKLGSFRDWGANLAGVLLNLFAVSVLTGFGGEGQMTQMGFLVLAVIVAALTIAFTLISAFSGKERVRYTAPAGEPKFKESIKSIAHNVPAISLTLMVLCINLFISFKQVFTTYYAAYYLQSEDMITLILTIMFTLPLIGLLFVPKLCRKLGNRTMFIISGVLAVLSGAVSLIGGSNTVLVIISAVLGGLTVSGVYANLWGCMPNAADYGEWKTGVKANGLIYAMATFAIKLGVALTSFLSGIFLDIAKYDAELAVQSAQTANKIYLFYGIYPIIVGIAAVICILPYNLNAKKMQEIETAIYKNGEQNA